MSYHRGIRKCVTLGRKFSLSSYPHPQTVAVAVHIHNVQKQKVSMLTPISTSTMTMTSTSTLISTNTVNVKAKERLAAGGIIPVDMGLLESITLKTSRLSIIPINNQIGVVAISQTPVSISDPSQPSRSNIGWTWNPSLPQREITTPGIPSQNPSIDDPSKTKNTPSPVEDAPNHNTQEKQAARLIVIRRIKMNKHKLRKLRKKMRFHDLKVKERRYVRREKAYLDEKMALITAARKFDAKEYVAGIIRRAKEEPLPRKWTDPLMPEWYREQEMEKERRLERYQKVVNMYLNDEIKLKKT